MNTTISKVIQEQEEEQLLEESIDIENLIDDLSSINSFSYLETSTKEDYVDKDYVDQFLMCGLCGEVKSIYEYIECPDIKVCDNCLSKVRNKIKF